jgi:NADH:ubiquinone oxidoreductase subunit B-like Fe-S oxidoreductase
MIRRIAIALALGAFLAGCGSTPEGVCKKLGALQEKSSKDSAKKEDPAECTKKVGEIKEKDPAKFECLAKCADGADYEKAKTCLVDCAKATNSAAK